MKKGLPSFYYPLFLNLSGKKCVVVGGGQVALRKVRTLLEAGAAVEVISPEPNLELIKMAEEGQISVLRRSYQGGDLKEASVAIAATDDNDINRQVAVEARRSRVLVNVVDDPENCDFIAPSYLRRGDITIAISTAGKSPALAKKIKVRLEEEFGDEFAALAQLIGEVRADVSRQGIRVDGDAWQQALDLDLLSDLVRRGNAKEARDAVLASLTGSKSK
ncbi:MAG: bifunctional precorrin-2 dehydrogenase/sirohydrochlorin ferrochelatase [Dehalococcoidales bacterium]|nr:bifunctional precorrin-2 dehydrogenase/sirohydrochlorin ferrochelatase [Dehalococcoidales bacterium]